MNTASKNRRWYYGVIVLACFLLSASCTGFLNNFNSLFLSTVSDALQVKRSQLALYSTFCSITTMICLPISSKLYQKLPMRLLALLGALAGAGAHLLYSLANSVWLFYFGGILAGLCESLACTIPINMTLSNWFQKRRGLATGIVYTGFSLISSLLSPAVSQILIRYGWRIAYRSVSAGLLFASLPFLLLIRPTPAAAGMQPYGAEKENACKQIPRRDYVSNMGLITTMLYLGASCGSPGNALIYDLTGGYRLAWLVFIIVSAAAFLCVLIANTLSMRDFSQRLGLHRKE